jgi:transposase InsO family protein
MDLFGPTTYKSIGGNLYCLVIVDDFSRYTWVMFLGDKSETPEVFKTFAKRAQREYNSPIVKIQSDNGTELRNMKIEEWCDEEMSSMSSPPPTRLNKMEWWKERTKH